MEVRGCSSSLPSPQSIVEMRKCCFLHGAIYRQQSHHSCTSERLETEAKSSLSKEAINWGNKKQ